MAVLLIYLPNQNYGYVIPKIAAMLGAIATVIFVSEWRFNRRAALVVGAMILSLVFSKYNELGFWGYPGAWTYGVMAGAIYFLLAGFSTERPWLKWAGVILSVIALAQRFGFDPFIAASRLPGFPASPRAVATIGSPVDLGAVLAMSATVCGVAWLPLIVLGIWSTGTRSAWIAAAFAMTPGRWKIAWAPLLLIPFFKTMPPKDVARWETWKIAAHSWWENPIVGTGPDTFVVAFLNKKTPKLVETLGPNYQTHAHNDVLQVLCTTGIIGLLAYLWFCWPLRDCAPLVALFVMMKFNPVPFEVLCCGALLAGTHARRKKDELPDPEGPQRSRLRHARRDQCPQ